MFIIFYETGRADFVLLFLFCVLNFLHTLEVGVVILPVILRAFSTCHALVAHRWPHIHSAFAFSICHAHGACCLQIMHAVLAIALLGPLQGSNRAACAASAGHVTNTQRPLPADLRAWHDVR